MAKCRSKKESVAGFDMRVDILELDEESTVGVLALHEPTAEGRSQRDRDKKGHRDREHDSEAVFEKHATNHSLHEGNGNEYRSDGSRRRKDGWANLGSTACGCFERGLPLVDASMNRFDDDDGIVYQEAD